MSSIKTWGRRNKTQFPLWGDEDVDAFISVVKDIQQQKIAAEVKYQKCQRKIPYDPYLIPLILRKGGFRLTDLNRKYCVKVHIGRTSQCLSFKGNAQDADGFASEINVILTKAARGKAVTRSIETETGQRGIAGITG